jgi:phosphohistidine phosphatase
MSCTLYLVRHAIAEVAGAGMSDGDRRLTAEGVKRMRRAADGLGRLGIVPDVVLSSPLQRAEETAAILVSVLAPKLPVEVYPPLAPGHAAEELLRGLHRYRSARHLFLVGHQPDLGDLASYLLTGSPALAPLPFKKGAVAAIEVGSLPPKAAGSLLWFLTPRHLRAM